LEAFIVRNGRCERIRTFDPLHPMQVRYQAAPHTEALDYRVKKAQIFLISQKKIANSKELQANRFQRKVDERRHGASSDDVFKLFIEFRRLHYLDTIEQHFSVALFVTLVL
jgi:hypothetical protein